MTAALLTEQLPTRIAGVPIAWTAREMVEIQQILMDPSLENTQKVWNILNRFYPSGLGRLSVESAWSYFIWFQGCGQDQSDSHQSSGGRDTPRAVDFVADGPLIVAAYQQAYQINLLQEELHWWRFHALFLGLPDTCKITKIMEYRTTDPSDVPQERRAFYRAMKARFDLGSVRKGHMTKEEHEQAFLKRLRRE
jgi:hypothetical protein